MLRTRDEVSGLLGGLELVPPGLVYAAQWNPGAALPDPGTAMTLAAVARL